MDDLLADIQIRDPGQPAKPLLERLTAAEAYTLDTQEDGMLTYRRDDGTEIWYDVRDDRFAVGEPPRRDDRPSEADDVLATIDEEGYTLHTRAALRESPAFTARQGDTPHGDYREFVHDGDEEHVSVVEIPHERSFYVDRRPSDTGGSPSEPDTEPVMGTLFEATPAAMTELEQFLAGTDPFERVDDIDGAVYDLPGGRVVLYLRSDRVRVMSRVDADMHGVPDYNLQADDRFEMVSTDLKPAAEVVEWKLPGGAE